MEPSESDIQSESLAYLSGHPNVWVVFPNDSKVKRYQKYGTPKHRPKGLADTFGMFRGGCAFAIEFKKPGGKATPEQIQFLAKVKEGGGKSLLAFSLDDVKRWMNELFPSGIPTH